MSADQLPSLGPSPSPAEISQRFDLLQEKLVRQWKHIGALNEQEQTIVVIPSISVEFNGPGGILQAYEERFLFLLLLLRQPRARMIYVTSQPILQETIDYYLSLLPGVIPSHARKRLFPVAVLDGSPRPLSRKVLDRPVLLERIRSLILDPEAAHLIPFNTTELEKELAVRLGIPMYGADPELFPLGTKSGGRRLFAEEGVRHPVGREGLQSLDDIVAAIASLRDDQPDIEQVLLKLNDAVSGQGNAVVDLRGIASAGAAGEAEEIAARVGAMQLEDQSSTVAAYLAAFAHRGGVVEERITGEDFRSPSVQMRVTPLGKVEVLSTHDQLLGGRSGQSYLGCLFPADPAYAVEITREAQKVGARLAREGVLGRFAIDFVVARPRGGAWKCYAIELNLRKGGTTHPYLTLEFLTDGRYDAGTGIFTTRAGTRKFYVASDHMESPHFKALTPEDLFDFVVRRGLHFSQATLTGVVLHMLSSVTEFGRFGLTAVGDTHEEAWELYQTASIGIEEEAKAALVDRGLPG
jgi:hypothetical protein